LGYLWSLLKPLALFVILYFVFTKFLKVGQSVPYYPVYLLLGIVVWNYFTEVTTTSVTAVVGKGDLMRKINFPKYVIILAGSFSALINLALNSVVIVVFALLSHLPLRPQLILLPIFVIELFVFSLAVAFFLGATFVRFRDISYIWDVAIQGLFYAVPVLYPLNLVPDKYAKLIILNPMAQIIQDVRYIAVTGTTTTVGSLFHSQLYYIIPISIVGISVVIASWYFRHRSKYFAEEV
jgi:ABC-2 type transport system permease protein